MGNPRDHRDLGPADRERVPPPPPRAERVGGALTRPRRSCPGGLAVAAAVFGLSGCAPLPILHDARITGRGGEAGVAGAFLVPVSATNTGQERSPQAAVAGWSRFRVSERLEGYATFQVPAFAIGLGLKAGLVGPERGSPFALAVAADGSASIPDGRSGWGASALATANAAPGTDLTFVARYGVTPGLSPAPALLGAIDLAFVRDGTTWHVAAGWLEAVHGEGLSGPLAMVGYSD